MMRYRYTDETPASRMRLTPHARLHAWIDRCRAADLAPAAWVPAWRQVGIGPASAQRRRGGV